MSPATTFSCRETYLSAELPEKLLKQKVETSTVSRLMSPPSILLHRGTVLTHVHHNGKDQVTKREDTDVLIEGNIIRKIAPRILDSLGPLNANSGIEIIDCTGKIISPGFVDTHHHLWQTQLKGRHAEQNLLGLMSSGKHIILIFRLS